MKKTGGAQFDPKAGQMFFIAGSLDRVNIASSVASRVLVAVNELSKVNLPTVKKWIKSGCKVFIDSGVFNLTNEHARAHGCSMDDALGLAPSQIDGYDELERKYIELCSSIGEESWGYIEVDQGGCENKIKTRARLEAIGLRPIPVYHPLNDGWDYFDFLAQNYDRICFGNVVQASPEERLHLITTAFIRRKKYPHLWVHLLGVTPNELVHSCPSSSCDSSTWLSAVRWSTGPREYAVGKPAGKFDQRILYNYDADRDAANGSKKAVKLAAFQAEMNGRNWSRYCVDLERVMA